MELSDSYFWEILCKILEDPWILQIAKWVNEGLRSILVVFLAQR